MKTERITHYGKGLFELSPEIKKIKRMVTASFFKVLCKEFGLFGTVKIFWNTLMETGKMKKRNWTEFEKRQNLSKEKIDLLIEDIAIMKVLTDTVGERKAKDIVSKMLTAGNDHLMEKHDRNLLLMPVKEFISLDDGFKGFKEFIIALENAVEAENIHKIDITDDSENSFGFKVNACVMHELAKEMGNTKLCFLSCHLDDVVFPRIGPQIGFRYRRLSTLPEGGLCCDFRFNRI